MVGASPIPASSTVKGAIGEGQLWDLGTPLLAVCSSKDDYSPWDYSSQ